MLNFWPKKCRAGKHFDPKNNLGWLQKPTRYLLATPKDEATLRPNPQIFPKGPSVAELSAFLILPGAIIKELPPLPHLADQNITETGRKGRLCLPLLSAGEVVRLFSSDLLRLASTTNNKGEVPLNGVFGQTVSSKTFVNDYDTPHQSPQTFIPLSGQLSSSFSVYTSA